MKTLLKNGMVCRDHESAETDVLLDGRTICAVGGDLQAGGAKVVDVVGAYTVSGFTDVHTHGAVGVDVNGANAKNFGKVYHFQVTRGTTSWQSFILTNTREQILVYIGERSTWEAIEYEGADLMGTRLRKPPLYADYKGAMPKHLFQKPNMELLKEYQDATRGDIYCITVSPEVEGILEFIPEIKKLGMAVAIGHSGVDYDAARKVIASRATAPIHTGNAVKLLHQHFPAVWGAVLKDDNLCCRIICNGRHLHPGAIRLVIKARGLDQAMAIAGLIMATGPPGGDYKLGASGAVVVNGGVKLKSNGTKASSTLTTGGALLNPLESTGKPLEQILPLLIENPAKLIGVYDRIGSIEKGKEVDVIILDKDCQVIHIYLEGKEVYRK